MRHLLSVSNTVFRLFPWCYPEEFRHRFGPEMADTFAQQLQNESRKRGVTGALQVSLRAVSEVFTAAIPHVSVRSRSAPRFFERCRASEKGMRRAYLAQ